MTALDDWLVAVHILCAVIWVGGAFATQLYAIRAQGGAIPLGPFAKQAEFVGQRAFMPASIVLLVTGLWLISRDVFEFEAWNIYGLVVIVLSAAVGAGFLGPESGRIGKLVDDRGDDDPEVAQRLGRLFLLSRVELVLLISVILVMTLKPGT